MTKARRILDRITREQSAINVAAIAAREFIRILPDELLPDSAFLTVICASVCLYWNTDLADNCLNVRIAYDSVIHCRWTVPTGSGTSRHRFPPGSKTIPRRLLVKIKEVCTP